MMKMKQILVTAVVCAMSVAGVISVPMAGISAQALESVQENHQINGESYGNYGDLTYYIFDDDTIGIVGCDESVTSVDIPAEIDGMPITNINIQAFAGCSSLASVTIPDSVTSIFTWAFAGCESLTDITIPESVIAIGGNAFLDTPWLEAKKQENPLVIVNDILIDGSSCVGDVEIPYGITSIVDFAFAYCNSLTSIIIPNSVKSVDVDVFFGCEALASITINNPSCEIYDHEITIPDIFNIYGYDNSTAQAYAEKYNRTFVSLGAAPEPKILLGDLDDNGKLDISDATAVLTLYARSAAGLDTSEFTESQKKAADINGDGSINISDATEILTIYARHAAGLV